MRLSSLENNAVGLPHHIIPSYTASISFSILVSSNGTLPAINYDGIEDSYQPFQHPSPSDSERFRGPFSHFQEHFLGARRGSRYTGLSIAAGLRGKLLVPSIMKDFRCWMFMRPDM